MPHDVTYRDALGVWCRVAALSFGGPAGQIAVMHRILVEEKNWVSEARFLHALNYCMLLPGPEAQQLATYIGWLLHGTRGGLTAGLLFVLPGFVSILALSIVYAYFQEVALISGLFFGLKAAVLAIVVAALIRIGRKALKNSLMVAISAAAFLAIFAGDVPFPVIIGAAALTGLVGARYLPHLFLVIQPKDGGTAPENGAGPAMSDHHVAVRPRPGRTLIVGAVWLAVWLVPLLAMAALLGREHVLCEQAVFFSKAAMVTFGGAYSVLSYIAQQAVEVHGWLVPGEMLDGLGMAETTPGPLIQVVQFVGFMGAFRNAEPFSPLLAGVLGSVVTTWATFAPCFLWIFVGAPYIEYLRHNRALQGALSTITSAVVGVILNLAVWFGLHVVFARVEQHELGFLRLHVPDFQSVSIPALVLTSLAFFATFKLRWGMMRVIGVAALLGIVATLLGLT